MANPDHLKILRQGVDAWNAWRTSAERSPGRTITPDLSGADLRGADLSEANLSQTDLRGVNLGEASPNWPLAKYSFANLGGANLSLANLSGANLSGADLSGADLSGADLSGANFREANLSQANLIRAFLLLADLQGADLSEAVLRGANLSQANLSQANLSQANLSEADLRSADLLEANLSGADLSGANLARVSLVDANLRGALLTGCRIYGVSAWGLKLSGGTRQQDLVITAENEPEITVDNIEVAQFIYLLLNNQKVREVIDTITSKVVLILGRFTDERKGVLDALRDELRKRDYLPILFDFDPPARRNTDETITLLARMARFVIADISDAKSVLQELRAIVPELPNVPVQPVIIASQDEPGMFDFYRHFPWFLPVHRYETPVQLLNELSDRVIKPSETKALEFRSFPPHGEAKRRQADKEA
jgi:uncharacterized protein YjbI with pentapeptide repeats